VVRADHPLAAMTLTTDTILAFPFLVVELTGSEDMGLGGFTEERRSRRRTWIDRLLVETEERQKGVCTGRVVATVPFYSAVAPILRSTDMVATLPHSIATSLAERERLAVLPLPYERLLVTVEAAWSKRLGNDRELQWLIDRATALVES
jgi:DNA-binding transcriptional LysR family regulator